MSGLDQSTPASVKVRAAEAIFNHSAPTLEVDGRSFEEIAQERRKEAA
jgi:hypothetical protein